MAGETGAGGHREGAQSGPRCAAMHMHGRVQRYGVLKYK